MPTVVKIQLNEYHKLLNNNCTYILSQFFVTLSSDDNGWSDLYMNILRTKNPEAFERMTWEQKQELLREHPNIMVRHIHRRLTQVLNTIISGKRNRSATSCISSVS